MTINDLLQRIDELEYRVASFGDLGSARELEELRKDLAKEQGRGVSAPPSRSFRLYLAAA